MTIEALITAAISAVETELDRRHARVLKHIEKRWCPRVDEFERFAEQLIDERPTGEQDGLRRELRALVARHDDAVSGVLTDLDKLTSTDVLDPVRVARADLREAMR